MICLATNNSIIRLGNIIRYDENIKAYIEDRIKQAGLSVMTGSTETTDGITGTVPPPLKGLSNRYLRCDGEWEVPSGTYSLPAATSSVLGGVKTGNNITNTNGTLSLTKVNITNALGYEPPTSNVMKGADGTNAGAVGLVPAPSAVENKQFLRGDGTWDLPSIVSTTANGLCPKLAGDNTKFLRADGTWQIPPDTTYSAVTTSANGLMTPELLTKLNGIATGATKVTVDSALSTSSTNPVQNKVVAYELSKKLDITTNITADNTYVNVMRTYDTTNSLFVSSIIERTDGADKTSKIYRIISPNSPNLYTDLWTDVTPSKIDWKFLSGVNSAGQAAGETKIPLAITVDGTLAAKGNMSSNGYRVLTADNYVVQGFFSCPTVTDDNGIVVDIGFTPWRVLYAPLTRGQQMCISEATSTGFRTGKITQEDIDNGINPENDSKGYFMYLAFKRKTW